MLSFQPTFSLSSFTFIKRLFFFSSEALSIANIYWVHKYSGHSLLWVYNHYLLLFHTLGNQSKVYMHISKKTIFLNNMGKKKNTLYLCLQHKLYKIHFLQYHSLQIVYFCKRKTLIFQLPLISRKV